MLQIKQIISNDNKFSENQSNRSENLQYSENLIFSYKKYIKLYFHNKKPNFIQKHINYIFKTDKLSRNTHRTETEFSETTTTSPSHV